ncbi:histidine kinase dimerization/phosphoacceptor domain -containing protein [Methylovirgula sp. HY1]|uniref:histidine kinase dimerization/phosphoacceptor domain -containing protein n=1 Tax=Methylovirgula sp. HY1 TaxID=2822761 RepID=UPI00351CD792
MKAFIVEANRRLLALGTTHNIMYRSQQMRAVPTKPFLTALCSAIGTTPGANRPLLRYRACERRLMGAVAIASSDDDGANPEPPGRSGRDGFDTTSRA